ncbi:MAG TPA: hypothetical protein VNX68_19175 [Nitrosopumilaceae archaeon]|jgi:hypothetical protein|nr:hypothetical protein [Nitrosopumilaceae archaeon]
MKLAIDEKGIVTFIYDDELSDLCSEGSSEIKRVSNVEPDPMGGWSATMLDGIKLGPYPLRNQALEAEVKYLEAKLF